MRDRNLLLLPFLMIAAVAVGAQDDAPTSSPYKAWLGRYEEVEDLLRTAEIVSIADIGTGVTNPKKVVLQAGDQTLAAAFKPIRMGRQGGFWESYQAEVAAYELDKLLGLDMVPPTVVRRINGSNGSLQLWVDNCQLYSAVQDQTPRTPSWSHQLSRMKMFDSLIRNDDRNAGNFLVDPDWHIILIDHSRAFIARKNLADGPNRLPVQFDRRLVERLRTLNREDLDKAMREILKMGGQIEAIIARRDALLYHLDELIKEKSEALVLF